jgi:hypothetical protein
VTLGWYLQFILSWQFILFGINPFIVHRFILGNLILSDESHSTDYCFINLFLLSVLCERYFKKMTTGIRLALFLNNPPHLFLSPFHDFIFYPF